MRRDETEKMEIIHLVEYLNLSVKRSLEELNVPRSTFYRWYKRYQEDGEAGLIDQRPNPCQIWNRIPQEVKQQVVVWRYSIQTVLPGKLPGCLPTNKAISSLNQALIVS